MSKEALAPPEAAKLRECITTSAVSSMPHRVAGKMRANRRRWYVMIWDPVPRLVSCRRGGVGWRAVSL